jgi:SAM-dependent methyltransferase
MLEFVKKQQYWALLDSGIDAELAPAEFPWHLKSVQDLLAYSLLDRPANLAIAEIGGGKSRLLPALAENNQCTNIERFEGQDGGPSTEVILPKVRNVHAYVGQFDERLEPSSFDALVSVSVVEQISNEDLPDFIRDCWRIVKTGGRMIHLVGMYLAPDRVTYNEARIALYQSAFDALFKPLCEPQIGGAGDLEFSESYCTNPDNIMYQWNRVAPKVRPLRETAQLVTLVWAGCAL